MEKERLLISQYCFGIRKKTGLSQINFSKGTGFSKTYFYKVERGLNDVPTREAVFNLVLAYGFTKEDLDKIDLGNLDREKTYNYVFSRNDINVKSIHDYDEKQCVKTFIDGKLLQKGYKFDDIKIHKKDDIERKLILKFNKNLFTNPIYDAMGANPDGALCYLFIIPPSRRGYTDHDACEHIYHFISTVVSSVSMSEEADKNQNIEIVFGVTFKSTGRKFRFTEELIERTRKTLQSRFKLSLVGEICRVDWFVPSNGIKDKTD